MCVRSCICKTVVGLANFDQFIRMRNWIPYYPAQSLVWARRKTPHQTDVQGERGADMQIWIMGRPGLSTALSPSHEFWGVEGASSQQIVVQLSLDSEEARGQPVDP